MKIALFSDVYVPAISGVSTSTQLLRNELIKQGHEVFVYTVKDPDAKTDDNNIVRITSLPFISAKRMAVNINPQVRYRIKKQKFDVIHTQTEFGLGVFGRSIARQEDIPFVHTFHTIYEDFTKDMMAKWPRFVDNYTAQLMRRISRKFCNSADRVIVPTAKAVDLLRKYGVVAPLDVIPTGLDLERFSLAAADDKKKLETRSQLGLKPDDLVLLYLGRVSNEKHIDELLDYLFKLFPQMTKLKLVITGEGAAFNRLVKRVATERQNEHVLFTGPVPVTEVPHYYAMADIFTSASQSETQGLTYIEAQASGVPILVREDPALEGIVENGYNGHYFIDEDSFNKGLFVLLKELETNRENIFRQTTLSATRYNVSTFANRVVETYIRAGKEKSNTGSCCV
ncbi:MAG TPA: glycosyltransferase family 4 protein [Clostridiaceae bacterium]|nr:glycosyltransferase family 4 protein [Clostridiaceae bacterium]